MTLKTKLTLYWTFVGVIVLLFVLGIITAHADATNNFFASALIMIAVGGFGPLGHALIKDQHRGA